MTSSEKSDAIIIGAGAAGLMCAMTSSGRGKKVLVIDHRPYAGSKIMVSGGGHANLTNMNVSSENYISENPRFPKSALAGFKPIDMLNILNKERIAYEEREDGNIFLKRTASELLKMLQTNCKTQGVIFALGQKIESISKTKKFIVETNIGVFEADKLIIATGGMSYSKLGASGLGYEIATAFGHDVVEPRPGLVPLLFDEDWAKSFGQLSGLSVNARVKTGKIAFTSDVLFTHKGLSGPAILQVSSYWQTGSNIVIDLVPTVDLLEHLKAERPRKAEMVNVLSGMIPNRLAKAIIDSSKPMNEYSEKQLITIAEKIKNWRIMPVGTSGYDKAEVTVGGVDTKKVSSKNMESQIVKGLYFIGEVLDVTGQLGGYNLHWAWASGVAAGRDI